MSHFGTTTAHAESPEHVASLAMTAHSRQCAHLKYIFNFNLLKTISIPSIPSPFEAVADSRGRVLRQLRRTDVTRTASLSPLHFIFALSTRNRSERISRSSGELHFYSHLALFKPVHSRKTKEILEYKLASRNETNDLAAVRNAQLIVSSFIILILLYGS